MLNSPRRSAHSERRVRIVANRLLGFSDSSPFFAERAPVVAASNERRKINLTRLHLARRALFSTGRVPEVPIL